MGAADAELVERAMRRWIDLVAARDIEGLRGFLGEFYAPDARIDLGAGAPDAGAGEGVEVIIDWARDAFADLEYEAGEFRYELEDVIDTGSGVIAPARSVGRFQGQEFETRFSYLFRVERGKIVSMAMYATPEEARAAAAGRAAADASPGPPAG